MGYPNFKSLLAQWPTQSSEVGLPDMSVHFDAEGWPVFVTPKKTTAADDDLPLVTPKPRQRKQRAMQARSAAKSSPNAATPAPSVAELPENDAPILRVRTGKTAEANKRFEVTAIVDLDGAHKRIHISTFTLAKDGPAYFARGEHLAIFVRRLGQPRRKL